MGGAKPAQPSIPTPAAPTAPQGNDLDFGGNPETPQDSSSDKPFDSEPFDAGVEADEATDPKKFIEQLTGKLGQSLRKYTETQGNPDFELEKFAVNSVLAATHTAKMDPQDQKDIINKVKSAGENDSPEPTSGETPEVTPEPNGKGVPIPDESESELNEMALTDHNVVKLIKIYDNSSDQIKTILTRLVSYSGKISREEFIRDLQDEVDYEDMKYIFDKLKQIGVKIPEDDIQKESCMLKNPKKNNMFQKGSNDILKQNLEIKENLSTFVGKSKIKSKLSETFNNNMETAPIVKPEVKPNRTTEPKVKPNRRNKPFLPSVTPGVEPQPKANNG